VKQEMAEDCDVLIVGGGSAGCVVAERLSSDQNLKVVLVEAGRGDRHPLHAFPMLTGHYFRKKVDNWYFHTQPQAELANREIFWPRGKRLGGSSIFNGMVYARGNAGDYDHWAQLGNGGWSFQEVLPYFKRNERHEDGESDLHGGSGLLHVSHARANSPLIKAFIKAGEQAGYPLVNDMNGRSAAGVGYYDFNYKDGRRSNSAGALLENASSRKNFRLVANATVERLIFDGRRAVGVILNRNGTAEEIRARRQVVLSAGAIGSPQILMLSGIGPAEHLNRMSITVRADRPGVGENLIDHLDAMIRTSTNQPVSLLRELRVDRITLSLARAFVLGTGPVAESAISAGGYFHSREGLEYPDLQAFFMPISETGAAVWFPFTARARQVAKLHGYAVRIGPIRPQSRGKLLLSSPDPYAAPSIDPAYLTDPYDMEATIAGLKIARKILSQRAFDQYLVAETAPGPLCGTDEELRRYIKETANTVYHPVGTAKMGVDPMAVVDARLRVHGIDALRVIDASIMPTIPSGNTNAPTMMIAEKGAEMIAQDLRTGS